MLNFTKVVLKCNMKSDSSRFSFCTFSIFSFKLPFLNVGISKAASFWSRQFFKPSGRHFWCLEKYSPDYATSCTSTWLGLKDMTGSRYDVVKKYPVSPGQIITLFLKTMIRTEYSYQEHHCTIWSLPAYRFMNMDGKIFKNSTTSTVSPGVVMPTKLGKI